MITYALKKLLESRGLSSAGIKDIADAIERLTDDSYIRETLAKLIANLADGYSEDDTYPVGDYVFYEDVLYKCVEPVTVGESFDPNKWVKTTIEEMFINAGGGGSSLKNIKDAENGGVVEGLLEIPDGVTGKVNTASGKNAHAEGGRVYSNSAQGTTASGYASHAEGVGTTASGDHSHTEGRNTTASATNSHAEGNKTQATNSPSHAEGYETVASGISSHAEGENTTASGKNGHSEGSYTTASGDNSHTEGTHTTASGKMVIPRAHIRRQITPISMFLANLT